MDKEKTESTSASTSTDDESSLQLVPPSPRSAAPWLMFQHGKTRKGKNKTTRKNQTFYNICEPNKTYVKRIPEMHSKVCVGSSSNQGWLILVGYDKPDDYFLWNPVSLEKIQLPSIFSEECILNGALLSPPSDPDSIVMLLYGRDPYYLLFCHPGDKKWIRKDLAKSENCPKSIVALRGKFYVMCTNNRHLQIEKFDGPAMLFITMLEVSAPCSLYAPLSRRDVKYVECCDELFMVRLKFHNQNLKEVIVFQIFRMDFSVLKWEEVRSLGDRVLFLGRNTAICCSATEMGFTRGGYVYFFLDKDESLYKFDLEDESISVSLPCPNLPTPWCSPEWVITPTVRCGTTDGKNSRTEDKIHINDEDEAKQKKVLQHYDIDVYYRTGDKIHISSYPSSACRTGDKIHINDEDNEERDTIIEAKQKKVLQHYDNEEINNWGMLHEDIVALIATYLHPVDYMHFRKACRAFRSALPAIKWRTSTRDIKESDSLSPWLVFKKNDGLYNFIDPMHSNEKYVMNLSDLLSDAQIRFSKDGWLVMSKGERSIFFFNPVTRETIQLPDLPYNNSFDGICFSSSPTSSDCSVFAISEYVSYLVEIISIHRGDDSWTYRFHNNHLPYAGKERIVFHPCLNNPVFYDGDFYCLGYNGALGVYEFNGSLSWKVLDKLQSPCNSYFDNFLVECEGDLLAVFVGHLGKWVKVFRLVRRSEEEMIWVQVESLGKHMLFLSHSSCLSAVAPRSGMENKIYFPRLNDNEEIIHYSLDTGKFHSFGSQHSRQDFYDTKTQAKLYCSWIEPKWSKNIDKELDWFSKKW